MKDTVANPPLGVIVSFHTAAHAASMYDFIETSGVMARVAASGALGSLVGLQAVWEEAARREVRLTPEDERVASLAGLWGAAVASTMGIVPAHDERLFEDLVRSAAASLEPFTSVTESRMWLIATAVGAGAIVAPRTYVPESDHASKTPPPTAAKQGNGKSHRSKSHR